LLFKISGAAFLGLALAGCSLPGTELEKATRLSPEGPAFDRILFQEYVDLSSSEYDEGDYRDSDAFAVRAIQSGTGGQVAPEEISARQLPEDKVGELTSARRRLVDMLGKGAAEKLPAEMARAQTGFDCWMQEQEENIQPDDIEACRSRFFVALEHAEDALKLKPIAQNAEPMAAAAPASSQYLVYFDFDKSELSPAAMAVLEAASSAARKLEGLVVTVNGYADLSGAADYNMELSKQRALTVSKALIEGGVAPATVNAAAFGQTHPAVMTADGVAEAGNRRVEILFGMK
jgi:outer membrane protein OmpA-like peptidoglycan-associated protein